MRPLSLCFSGLIALLLCSCGGGSSGGGGNTPIVPAVPLPQTGQTAAYATGDDGSLRKGVAWPDPRFSDNGDGTVSDRLTGLIWLKQVDCFAGKNWNDALSAAGALGNGACGLADRSKAGDWRVPNINELSSLISIAALNPALPVNPFANVRSSYYWSSSTFAEVTFNAWMVYLDIGYVDSVSKKSLVNLLPVRDGVAAGAVKVPKTGQTQSYVAGDDGELQKGAAWPSPRFTDNGNGTVSDNLTELVWLKNPNCLDETIDGARMMKSLGLMTFADALTWTNALAAGSCGLSDGSRAGDWRVPNRNELASLIDRSRANPALPTVNPFDKVAMDGYWSSSSLLPYDKYKAPVAAWTAYLGNGVVTVNDSIRGYTGFVWPIRDKVR